METRKGIYDDIAGGFRKRAPSRHGHEVRPIGVYIDGVWNQKSGATGLGVDQWIKQRDCKASLDTTLAIIPAGSSWSPYAVDELGRKYPPYYEANRYHGSDPNLGPGNDVPYYAVPGVQWMWPEGERIGNVRVTLPEDELIHNPSTPGRITLYRSYVEVRNEFLADKDGYSVKKPITILGDERRNWGLFYPTDAGFAIPASKESGAVEFLLKMDMPANPESTYGVAQLDAETGTSPNEHVCQILLTLSSGQSIPITFGLRKQFYLLHEDRSTNETIELDPRTGVPTHYTGGMLGVHWCQEAFDDPGIQNGTSFAWCEMRDSEGNIIQFQWNKWYRIRIEWRVGIQADGSTDTRINIFYGDPLERLRTIYFYPFDNAEYELPAIRYIRSTFEDIDLVSTFSVRRLVSFIFENDPDYPLNEDTISPFISGNVREINITNGYASVTTPLQTFHLAHVGLSWDPTYIEYGLTTELGQDPYPGILEAVVDLPIWNEDITITLEYYPAIFRAFEKYRTGLGEYDIKRFQLSITPKTFTFTIPKFTRIGKLFQGPSDFGHLKSCVVSGSGGQVTISAILGDGAKIMHSVKQMDLIDSLYGVGQSVGKVPRLCPKCAGKDGECPVCEGKRYLKEDSEIPEFILDNFLKAQKAPYHNLTYVEKLGLAAACHSYVNQDEESIRNFIARLYDVDPSSVNCSTYQGTQNVLVSISIPRGFGKNAFFSDINLLTWILDTIRPVGVEFVAAYTDSNIVEEHHLQDEIWGIKW